MDIPKGDRENYIITVSGLVQGVGFRPFIHRLANEMELDGWVLNTNENVRIGLLGDRSTVDLFADRISRESPPAAEIGSIHVENARPEDFKGFRIIKSENLSEAVTRVSPDIAVCEACLEDMKTQPNRIDYPFLNCTNCGPRFTIIRDLPYDRPRTTMQEFAMCNHCRQEYRDVLDRRFHAQPTACSRCGPEYELVAGRERIRGIHEILDRTSALINGGGIVAIKGLGGFFMACDALDP